MMNKKETSRLGLAKYLFILPVIAALLIFNKYDINAQTITNVTKVTDNLLINGKQPLYVVDGVPVDSISIGDIRDKIESMEIWKDSTAVARYGSRGANGVILITTRVRPLTKAEIQQMNKTATPNSEGVFNHVEEMPRFPGGEAALLKWLSENVTYPTSASEKGIQGRVVVRYIVRSDGVVDDVQIVRSLNPDCDAEAIRAVQAMPNWTPGKQNGKPVDVYWTLPIQFKLQPASKPAK